MVGGVGGAGDVVGGLGLSLVAVVVGCLGDVMGLAVVVVVVVVVMYLVGPAAAGGEVAVPPVAQHVVTVPVRPATKVHLSSYFSIFLLGLFFMSF